MIPTLLTQLWVQKLGWTLLHFLWQGTALAVICAVVRNWFARVLSPRGRYLLACATLTAMTVAPPLTYLTLPQANAAPMPVLLWSISSGGWQQLLPWVVAIWFLGVVAFSIRFLGGWRFTARLRSASLPAPTEWQHKLERIAARVGTSRPVRLLVSSLVEVPMVIGWLRPVVLVPFGALAGLPFEHLTALLAHELAHVRRHDYLASILQNIAEALLFYHPAVWWISEQIRAERELCCDDLAVAACGDVLTYAQALAELESRRPSRLTPALAANGGSLVNRIRRLIEPSCSASNNPPGPGTAWAMSLLWLAGAGIMTMHAAQTSVVAVAPPIQLAVLPNPALTALLFDPFLPASQVAQTTPAAPPTASSKSDKIRVEGRVLSASGENIPRANVQLMQNAVLSRELYSQATDASGNFVFEDVAPGRYVLKVTRVGYLEGGFGAQSADLLPAFNLQASMKDLIIRLIPNGVITGQVSNQDSDPVESASVSIYKQAYERGHKTLKQVLGRAATTDDEGKFRIAGLGPGRYYLGVQPQTNMPAALATQKNLTYIKTFYPSSVDFAGASPIDLAPGARLDRIDIRLRREPVYSVKGKVSLNGAPADASITVIPRDSELGRQMQQRNGTQARQGVFEIRDLPPGAYILQAREMSSGTGGVINLNDAAAARALRNTPRAGGQAEITLANSNLENVAVSMQPDIQLEGSFRADEGDLLAMAKSAPAARPPDDPFDMGVLGAMGVGLNAPSSFKPIFGVAAIDSGDLGSLAPMEEDGTFRITRGVVPGRYVWDIRNLPDTIYVKSVRFDSVDVTRAPLNIAAAGKLEVVLSDKAGSITGTLRNEQGDPLTGVTLTVWAKHFNPASPATGVRLRSTDPNGNFKVGGLPPGDYYVAGWEGEPANSGLLTIPEFLAFFTGEAATVTVGESASVSTDAKMVPRAKIVAALTKIP